MSENKAHTDTKNWVAEGLQHIWLPYTQMQDIKPQLPVRTAAGSIITLEDGRELIDGISSWWSSCHGFQHPSIVEAMQKQLGELSHIMLAGFANKPAYTLAAKLAQITPEGLDRVFFADSGSNAIEIAMKMAVQYWANQGNKRKNKFVSFKNGYHGETMGALSLGDPDGWTAKAFNNYMPFQFYVDLPTDEYGFAEFEDTIKASANIIAGLVIEPLVQGAGGLKFHSPDALAEIYRICKKHNILFIADEIMTGFWRTGSRFACMEAGITPDMMCVGKALTGGMIGLAATIVQNDVYNSFLNDDFDKAFLHGPTFMGNALACSAAVASLELFEEEDFAGKIENIEKFLIENLSNLRKLDIVSDVRVKGAIGVVELKLDDSNESWKKMMELRLKFIDEGVFIRPFKNVVYLMPNFNIKEQELKILTNAIHKVLGEI